MTSLQTYLTQVDEILTNARRYNHLYLALSPLISEFEGFEPEANVFPQGNEVIISVHLRSGDDLLGVVSDIVRRVTPVLRGYITEVARKPNREDAASRTYDLSWSFPFEGREACVRS